MATTTNGVIFSVAAAWTHQRNIAPSKRRVTVAALTLVASIATSVGAETFIQYRYSPLGLHYLAVQKLSYAAPRGESVWQCAYWADRDSLVWRTTKSNGCPTTLEEVH